MSMTVILNQIKKLKTKVTEAIKAGDNAAEEAAWAKLKEYFPKIAATLEAELKAEAEAKAAAELKIQAEMLVKAKAEMQELTVSELVKQNIAMNERLEELSQLFHKFSDAVMKNDAKHEHVIAELHDQIHELQTHCSGNTDFHTDSA